jgi:hypothetical protein
VLDTATGLYGSPYMHEDVRGHEPLAGDNQVIKIGAVDSRCQRQLSASVAQQFAQFALL